MNPCKYYDVISMCEGTNRKQVTQGTRGDPLCTRNENGDKTNFNDRDSVGQAFEDQNNREG